MDNTRASALIISRKGSLRDGLVALLDTMPQIGVVATADGPDEAPSRPTPTSCPSLVLLDTRSSGDGAWLTVRRAKRRWRGSTCVALTENVAQMEEAQAAGADAVLVNGFPAARLVATIVRLLPHNEDDGHIPVSVRNNRAGVTKGRPTQAARPDSGPSGNDDTLTDREASVVPPGGHRKK